jgi:hypothetical protein
MVAIFQNGLSECKSNLTFQSRGFIAYSFKSYCPKLNLGLLEFIKTETKSYHLLLKGDLISEIDFIQDDSFQGLSNLI